VAPQSIPVGDEVTVPLPSPSLFTVTVKSRTSVISRSIGAPAVRLTLGNVPPNILRGGDAALNADTVMVRLEPTGAWMLTGICWPLVGSETGTVVVAGTAMPGPVISTWIEAMSVTACAQAGVAPGNQRSSHANTREGID